MKKLLFATATVFAFCLFAQKTTAQSPLFTEPRPQVSVSGTAEIKVVPDEIYVEIGVEIRENDLANATMSADSRIEQAIKQLKIDGVQAKNIKTGYINVRPEFEYTPEGGMSDRVKYYVVTRQLEFCLTDVRKFDDAMAGLVQSGINNIYSVRLSTTKLREHRDEARRQAARAARQKAELLTAELGVKCGKATSISETFESYQPYPVYSNVAQNSMQGGGAGGDFGAGEGSLSVGMISVSATVNCSFLIE